MAGVTKKSGAANSARGRTFRETWGESWIAKLRTLPEALFQECVGRLQEGESAIGVARWLLTVPDRGGMKKVTNIHTMRRYLEVLRVRVREAKKKLPLPAVDPKKLRKLVAEESKRADNVVAISGGPMQPPPASKTDGQDESASIVQFLVNENAKLGESKQWLRATAAINWERFKAGAEMEKRIKMPIDTVNRISQQIINCADACTRLDMAAIARQKHLGTKTMENFDPISIDGVRVDQPAKAQVVNAGPVTVPAAAAPAQPADKPKELLPRLQELLQEVRAMKVEDRMLMRTVLYQVLELMGLKLEMKRAGEEAQKPDPQPEGDKANE
jgi:hypothetical protein